MSTTPPPSPGDDLGPTSPPDEPGTDSTSTPQLPDLAPWMGAAANRPRRSETRDVLQLRGCLTRGAVFILTAAAVTHGFTWWKAPHYVFEADQPFWLESLDQLAFQCMLWGFAWVLWKPDDCRRPLWIAKAGFCFQMALGTGGQSFTAEAPRAAAIAFMFVAMWHLLSRLGIGALGTPHEDDLPPP